MHKVLSIRRLFDADESSEYGFKEIFQLIYDPSIYEEYNDLELLDFEYRILQLIKKCYETDNLLIPVYNSLEDNDNGYVLEIDSPADDRLYVANSFMYYKNDDEVFVGIKKFVDRE